MRSVPSAALVFALAGSLWTSIAPAVLASGRREGLPALDGARGDSVDTRCSAPQRRQFDFWIGRWTVTDTSGATVGHSEITRVADGCGILEHWQGADGSSGSSLNTYDPQAGHWSQFWVGGGGLVLRLEGGLRGRAMVLSGHRRSRRGPLEDRITWTPAGDGTVRQVWEISVDGGSSWRTVFDGLYRAS